VEERGVLDGDGTVEGSVGAAADNGAAAAAASGVPLRCIGRTMYAVAAHARALMTTSPAATRTRREVGISRFTVRHRNRR
jgi:hypothetical protein